MAKLTLNDLTTLKAQASAISTINNNNQAIEDALENTLSRDGTQPNTMNASIDMNGNRLLNLPEPVGNNEPVRYGEFLEVLDSIEEVLAAAELVAVAVVEIEADRAEVAANTEIVEDSTATVIELSAEVASNAATVETNTDIAVAAASAAAVSEANAAISAAAGIHADSRSNVVDSYLLGGPVTITQFESGYIAKADGSKVGGINRRTQLLSVGPDTILHRDGSVFSTGSAVAPVAFYRGTTYLGFTGSGAPITTIRVGDLFSDADGVIVTSSVSGSFVVTLDQYIDPTRVAGLSPNFEILSSAFIHDFYTDDVIVGYVRSPDGVFISNASWSSTELVPAELGDQFYVTVSGTSQVFALSEFDADETFISGAFTGSQNNTLYTITNPDTKFVQASGTVAGPVRKLLGPKHGESEGFNPSFMIPPDMYAIAGEPMFIYPPGVCPDKSIELNIDLSEANGEVATVNEASPTTFDVTFRARRGRSFLDIGTSTVHVSSTPVSPVSARNLIFIGESLESLSNGAMVQETTRRLTGVGSAITISGVTTPTTFGLSNIYTRGTLGTGPVYHEGRSGWKSYTYLTQDILGGVVNAFWNPVSDEFDLNYYVTNNGFDSGSTTGGILSDGSNLTVLIWLNWNGVYSDGPEEDALYLGQLIDNIQSTHPLVDVIVIGAQGAPRINNKAFANGDRFVGQQEVFELAIRDLGSRHRAVCAARDNCEFLQISHVFDAEIGYTLTTQPRGHRTTTVVTGAGDHIHPPGVGLAMISDAVVYKLVNKYCQ